uniref:AAA-ATPase-like domain-containing protein n=2 Tax=Clastoptera arizonana TaxID=38151 RepID=A0A1B6DX39_9HEMI
MLAAVVKYYTLVVFSLCLNTSFSRCQLPRLNFTNLIETDYLVDKTLLIKAVFNASKYDQYMLMVYPMGFGRSLNMDMIKKFVEIEVDARGLLKPKKERKMLKLFSSKQNKTDGVGYLNIYSEENKRFFNKHVGKYPVIHFDFRYVQTCSFRRFFMAMKRVIRGEFIRHRYMFRGHVFTFDEKASLAQAFKNLNKLNPTIVESFNYILILINTLRRFYSKKVVVLVDDFDTPITKCALNYRMHCEQMYHFTQDFMTALYTSRTDVKFAIINSIFRLPLDHPEIKTYLFHEVNPFNAYYGFTETELHHLGKKFRVEEKEFHRMLAWYGNYHVANGEVIVAKPQSTIDYLKTRRFRHFFKRPKHVLLQHFLTEPVFREDVRNLLTDTFIMFPATNLTVDRLLTIRKEHKISAQLIKSNKTTNTVLNYFLALGCFTVIEEPIKDLYKVVVPNLSIKWLFRQLQSYLSKTLRSMHLYYSM